MGWDGMGWDGMGWGVKGEKGKRMDTEEFVPINQTSINFIQNPISFSLSRQIISLARKRKKEDPHSKKKHKSSHHPTIQPKKESLTNAQRARATDKIPRLLSLKNVDIGYETAR